MDQQTNGFSIPPKLKIGFCGASGTGKTTLVDLIEYRPKVTRLTRTVAKDLRGTKEGQDEILNNYSMVFKGLDQYITDRTIFDVCAYSALREVWNKTRIRHVLDTWYAEIGFPDILFYLPIEFPMEMDGERPDWDRENFDLIMRTLIGYYFPNYVTLSGSIQERLKEAQNAISSYCNASPSQSHTTDPGSNGL